MPLCAGSSAMPRRWRPAQIRPRLMVRADTLHRQRGSTNSSPQPIAPDGSWPICTRRSPSPQGVSQVNLPLLTTGTLAVAQAPNASVAEQDLVDAAGSSNVVTIAGQSDVALQALEQEPASAALDWALTKDLSESFDQQLEAQLINGQGSAANQLLGVLNVTGINTVAFTSGSPTGSSSTPSWARHRQPSATLARCRPSASSCGPLRWAWYGSAVDGASRPYIPPGGFGGFTVGKSDDLDSNVGPTPIGPLFGFPVYLDDAIPATLGTTANQDAIIALRPSDGV